MRCAYSITAVAKEMLPSFFFISHWNASIFNKLETEDVSNKIVVKTTKTMILVQIIHRIVHLSHFKYRGRPKNQWVGTVKIKINHKIMKIIHNRNSTKILNYCSFVTKLENYFKSTSSLLIQWLKFNIIFYGVQTPQNCPPAIALCLSLSREGGQDHYLGPEHPRGGCDLSNNCVQSMYMQAPALNLTLCHIPYEQNAFVLMNEIEK